MLRAKILPSPPPTARELEAKRALAQRELARRHLLPFVQMFHPAYEAGWIHQLITKKLEEFSLQVQQKLSPRLAIFMPPRHGKSILASTYFPAWHLGNNPTHEFIACSYNSDLPVGFSKEIRSILKDPAYQQIFPARLAPDSQGAEAWRLQQGGGFLAAGVSGGITGKGAHILGIDDPIKNHEEADSPLIRAKLWDFYTSTAYTRLAPGAGVLIIQTCWHDDDLAGRIQRQMEIDPLADRFEIIKFKAIADDDEFLYQERYYTRDQLTQHLEQYPPSLSSPAPDLHPPVLLRSAGEALHSERYPLPALLKIKNTLPPRFWAALYQQDPVPPGGAYFSIEQFQEINAVPPAYLDTQTRPLYQVFLAFDFAITDADYSNYTVGVVAIRTHDGQLIIIDLRKIRAGTYGIIDLILSLAAVHTTGVQQSQIGVEDGHIWKTLAPVLQNEALNRKQTLNLVVHKPHGKDKTVRARAFQGLMERQKVHFLARSTWFAPTRRDMLRFPAGAEKDAVDALAYIGIMAENTPVIREQKQDPQRPKWLDTYLYGGTNPQEDRYMVG